MATVIRDKKTRKAAEDFEKRVDRHRRAGTWDELHKANLADARGRVSLVVNGFGNGKRLGPGRHRRQPDGTWVRVA